MVSSTARFFMRFHRGLNTLLLHLVPLLTGLWSHCAAGASSIWNILLRYIPNNQYQATQIKWRGEPSLVEFDILSLYLKDGGFWSASTSHDCRFRVPFTSM